MRSWKRIWKSRIFNKEVRYRSHYFLIRPLRSQAPFTAFPTHKGSLRHILFKSLRSWGRTPKPPNRYRSHGSYAFQSLQLIKPNAARTSRHEIWTIPLLTDYTTIFPHPLIKMKGDGENYFLFFSSLRWLFEDQRSKLLWTPWGLRFKVRFLALFVVSVQHIWEMIGSFL